MRKVLLYGMGQKFRELMEENNWIDSGMDVCAIVDKQSHTMSSYAWRGKEIDVVGPSEIARYWFDFILITSTQYYDEISSELIKCGIDKDKLASVDDFLSMCIQEREELAFLKGEGVDIGGPSKGLFKYVYEMTGQCDIVNYSSQNIWGDLQEKFFYKEKELGNIIINDATHLDKIQDEQYGYVLSSNNLEHIANPLKALFEWKRILRKNGLMIVAVPCKEFTFDHKRKVVEFSHLVEDYENEIGEDDLTHLPEILELHDLEMDKPAGTYEQFKERSYKNYENRCLHQHVFDNDVLREMADYMKMEVLFDGIIFKRNWVIVLRKK